MCVRTFLRHSAILHATLITAPLPTASTDGKHVQHRVECPWVLWSEAGSSTVRALAIPQERNVAAPSFDRTHGLPLHSASLATVPPSPKRSATVGTLSSSIVLGTDEKHDEESTHNMANAASGTLRNVTGDTQGKPTPTVDRKSGGASSTHCAAGLQSHLQPVNNGVQNVPTNCAPAGVIATADRIPITGARGLPRSRSASTVTLSPSSRTLSTFEEDFSFAHLSRSNLEHRGVKTQSQAHETVDRDLLESSHGQRFSALHTNPLGAYSHLSPRGRINANNSVHTVHGSVQRRGDACVSSDARSHLPAPIIAVTDKTASHGHSSVLHCNTESRAISPSPATSAASRAFIFPTLPAVPPQVALVASPTMARAFAASKHTVDTTRADAHTAVVNGLDEPLRLRSHSHQPWALIPVKAAFFLSPHNATRGDADAAQRNC